MTYLVRDLEESTGNFLQAYQAAQQKPQTMNSVTEYMTPIKGNSTAAARQYNQGCGVLVLLWDSDFDSESRVRKFRTPDSNSRPKIRL